MLLAALIDAGVPPEAVLGPLRSALPPFEAVFRHETRRSVRVGRFEVSTVEDPPPARGLGEIESILDAADLPGRAVERARACFRILAGAEAEVHGVTPEEVHFHEVGAIDSLVDIIGVCLALDHLDPVEIVCSSLPLGSGSVATSHGRLPVPAPATLRLLEGIPTHPGAAGREVTTPTGAALAKTLVDRFGAPPTGVILASGTGAGTREAARDEPPNWVRVWTTAADTGTLDALLLLETNLDTATGEDSGGWIDALLAAGALDAWIVPTVQKKGRPGLLLSALVRPGDGETVRRAIFRETGTLGIRTRPVERTALPRDVVEMNLGDHRVRVKRAWLDGALIDERPEHEDVARIARETGRPAREIRAEIEAALARAALSRKRGDDRDE